jgi:transposase InsO family protein
MVDGFTTKIACPTVPRLADLDARVEALSTWLHWYNFHRPHMAHGGGMPMSVVNNVPGKHS